jgi:hypothetical protein
MEIKPGSKASRFIIRALNTLASDLELDCEHLTNEDALADAGNDLGYVRALIRGLEAETNTSSLDRQG